MGRGQGVESHVALNTGAVPSGWLGLLSPGVGGPVLLISPPGAWSCSSTHPWPRQAQGDLSQGRYLALGENTTLVECPCPLPFLRVEPVAPAEQGRRPGAGPGAGCPSCLLRVPGASCTPPRALLCCRAVVSPPSHVPAAGRVCADRQTDACTSLTAAPRSRQPQRPSEEPRGPGTPAPRHALPSPWGQRPLSFPGPFAPPF